MFDIPAARWIQDRQKESPDHFGANSLHLDGISALHKIKSPQIFTIFTIFTMPNICYYRAGY